MSTQSFATEFTIGGQAEHLSEPSDTSGTESDADNYTIHGVALGANDVTKGSSGITKKWQDEALKESAHTLEGTELVEDHNNNARGVVGRVTKAGYKDGVGVIYEAELYDEELAQNIKNGLLEVSIRGYHTDVDDMEENEEGQKIVKDITFDNLSIVPNGAAPSNTVNMGEHAELSVAQLRAFTDELMDVEPSDYVEWDGNHGIVFNVDDGTLTVEVMEEIDGKWRATGTQTEVDTDTVSMWDIEDSDIGAPKDTEEMAPVEEFQFDSEEEAMKIVEEDDSGTLTDVHKHGSGEDAIYMPGADMDEFTEWHESKHASENMSLITEGMKFFSTVNNSEVIIDSVMGNIVMVKTMDGDSQWKEETDNIIRKLADGDWEHAGMADTSEMIDTPTWQEGDMVQWQVNPSMKGKVVHNPVDEPFVMVEILENGQMSGYTLTAGYSDLEEIDNSSMSYGSDEEEMASEAKYTRGDWVNWDTRNSTEIGTVIGGYMDGEDIPDFRGDRSMSPEGDEVLYALRMYKERDGSYHPIEGKPIGHYERSLRSANEPSDVTESYVELASAVDTNLLNSVAMLKSDALIERPDSGETRALIHTPVDNQITDSDMQSIMQTIESELGMSVMNSMTDSGILFGPVMESGSGKNVFNHAHLDVIESAVDNQIGIAQKSSLFAAGDTEMRIQPCYKTSEQMPEGVLNEITRLLKFVTGVDANAYYDESTLCLDTAQQVLSHASLDVAEILVRRMGDANDITVMSNAFKVSDMDASEEAHHDMADGEEEMASDSLGRSNHENYDVVEEQWVQWYPSDTTEEHGFATSIDEDDVVTIEVWTQNSDGEWMTDGDTITKDMELVEPWGNFPREQDEFQDALDDGDPRKNPAQGPQRREGSDVNPEGSAASARQYSNTEYKDTVSVLAEDDIEFSESIKTGLKNKAKEHNEEYGDEEGKRVTYRMLKSVFRRGAGAYSDSHREGMTRQQWSYARVNAFLYLVRNGQPENDAYTQDNDLLPEEHPRYNETEEENTAGSNKPAFLTQFDTVWTDEYSSELASMDELDIVYSEWNDAVNMTASELREWSAHPCSREASINPEKVIRRNLRLLMKDKDEWNEDDIDDGKRTVSFIRRMRGNRPDNIDDGTHGCPSNWSISLMNWAYSPYDTMPDIPDNDKLPDADMIDVELAEYQMHDVSFDGTTTKDWDGVSMEDFDTDDLGEISNHFIVSETGFPPEDYEDLKMPVVEPNGELSLDALIAVKGGQGPSAAVGISDSEKGQSLGEYINELARENFDKNWGQEEASQYENLTVIENMDDNDMSGMNYMNDMNKMRKVQKQIKQGNTPEQSHMFPNKIDAIMMAQQMGLQGAHKRGDMFMPGRSPEHYMDAIASMGYGSMGYGSMGYNSMSYGSDDSMNMDSDEEDESEMSVSDLMDYDMHEPSYDGATEQDWNSPTLDAIMDAYGWNEEYDSYESLPDEAKETIGNHFLISMSGFPADTFGDYKLPVVEPNGELSKNALMAAKGGRGVSQVKGLNDDMEQEITMMINELAEDEFDMEFDADMDEDSMSYGSSDEEEMSTMRHYPNHGVSVLTGDDFQHRYGKSGESELDSMNAVATQYTTTDIDTDTDTTMTDSIEELEAQIENVDNPVVLNQDEVASLQQKASQYDDISDDIAELRERTAVLDEVNHDLVEELSEADEPMVIESTRYESLSAEAEQVKEVYASELESEMPVFSAEELMDKFTIQELSEKYEDAFGSVDEELSANPKGVDVDEEELEDNSDSEDELSDEIKQKQDELRERMRSGR